MFTYFINILKRMNEINSEIKPLSELKDYDLEVY